MTVPSERSNFQMDLPLPVIPLEAELWVGSGLVEQLSHLPDVVLVPRGLRQIHFGHVKVALKFRFCRLGVRSFRFGTLALNLFGLACPVDTVNGNRRPNDDCQQQRHRSRSQSRHAWAPSAPAPE